MSNITGGELSLSLTNCEVAHSIDNYLSTTLSHGCEPISIQLVKGPKVSSERLDILANECRIESSGVGAKKGIPRMKRTLNTYETLLGSSYVCFIGFLVLGVLTFILWHVYLVTGWQSLGLIAYLSGILDIALLLWLMVLLTLRSHASATSEKVLKALIYTLERDTDPRVRSKAAVGLVQLDKELSFGNHVHHELDDILIRAMQKDSDSGVRSKATVGLAELELELEQPNYHHIHDKLDNMIFNERQ